MASLLSLCVLGLLAACSTQAMTMTSNQIKAVLTAWGYDGTKADQFLQKLMDESISIESILTRLVQEYQNGRRNIVGMGAEKLCLMGVGGNGGPMANVIKLMCEKGFSNFTILLVLDYSDINSVYASHTVITELLQDLARTHSHSVKILLYTRRLEKHKDEDFLNGLVDPAEVTVLKDLATAETAVLLTHQQNQRAAMLAQQQNQAAAMLAQQQNQPQVILAQQQNQAPVLLPYQQKEADYVKAWEKQGLKLETVSRVPVLSGKVLVIDAITGMGMKIANADNVHLSVNLQLITEIPDIMKRRDAVQLVSIDTTSGQDENGNWHPVLKALKCTYTPHVLLSVHWHKPLTKTLQGTKLYFLRTGFTKVNQDGTKTVFTFSNTALVTLGAQQQLYLSEQINPPANPTAQVDANLLLQLNDVVDNHSDKLWLRWVDSPRHVSSV